MKLQQQSASDDSLGLWQLVMLILSVYVLGAMLIDTALSLPPETAALLAHIDNLICLVFIGDFATNLFRAKSKLGYLKWGWIDLVSSIPNLDILRWGRVVRVVRILRVLRGVRSTRFILKTLLRNRARATFATVATIAGVLVIFASIAILNLESVPEANIKTGADALWWSFATITTVGYGDRYPVTAEGRLVAALLMTAGIGLFGTFTAFVASVFFDQGEKEEKERDERILAELQNVVKRLEALETQVRSERIAYEDDLPF